mmetsp:Transcript_32632/g.92532  ORF Transcript_32632/g.92532 Transcript_32632/m.92532 type:complete len:360 (-) Transcript_32632:670-1749(-)
MFTDRGERGDRLGDLQGEAVLCAFLPQAGAHDPLHAAQGEGHRCRVDPRPCSRAPPLLRGTAGTRNRPCSLSDAQATPSGTREQHTLQRRSSSTQRCARPRGAAQAVHAGLGRAGARSSGPGGHLGGAQGSDERHQHPQAQAGGPSSAAQGGAAALCISRGLASDQPSWQAGRPRAAWQPQPSASSWPKPHNSLPGSSGARPPRLSLAGLHLAGWLPLAALVRLLHEPPCAGAVPQRDPQRWRRPRIPDHCRGRPSAPHHRELLQRCLGTSCAEGGSAEGANGWGAASHWQAAVTRVRPRAIWLCPPCCGQDDSGAARCQQNQKGFCWHPGRPAPGGGRRHGSAAYTAAALCRRRLCPQ